MKNFLRLYSGLILLSLLLSCNNGTPDSVKSAKEVNAKRIDTEAPPGDSQAVSLSKDDANFLVNTASDKILGKQLGQMAVDRSSNEKVKEFAAMIVKDLGESEEKLKALATKKNVMLPDDVSNKEQKRKEDLMKKKGIEFDRSYVDITVNDYNRDIREYGRAAKYATDPEVKSFASGSLALLYTHLDSARNLQKVMKKKIDISTALPK